MPPLSLFGRSWHVSSDDLALPGIAGILFHGSWTVLIVVQVSIIGLPDDCPQRAWASSSILWLLASFALTTVLQTWLTAASLKGGMLEEHKRTAVPLALYCILASYCFEAAALVYYTTVFFRGAGQQAASCYTKEELARTSIPDIVVHQWFIFTTWGMLGAVLVLLVLLYNVYPDQSLEAWADRVNCLSYALCCWRSLRQDEEDDTSSAGSSTPTVLRLAKVFGDVFYPLNFSFTDIIAAITLVGITHRSRAHGTGTTSHQHALIAAAAAGLLGQGKQEGFAEALAVLDAAAAAKAAARSNQQSAVRSAAPQNCAASAAIAGFGGIVNSEGAAVGMIPTFQAPVRSSAAKGTAVLAATMAAKAPTKAGIPNSRSHQQLLQLLLIGHDDQHETCESGGLTASGDGVGSPVQQINRCCSSSGTPGVLGQTATSRQKKQLLPTPVDALVCSSSGGSATATAAAANEAGSQENSGSGLPADSADTVNRNSFTAAAAAAVPPAASATSGGNSLWQQAVRQASTLAVAPGYGLNPATCQGSGFVKLQNASTAGQHQPQGVYSPLLLPPQQRRSSVKLPAAARTPVITTARSSSSPAALDAPSNCSKPVHSLHQGVAAAAAAATVQNQGGATAAVICGEGSIAGDEQQLQESADPDAAATATSTLASIDDDVAAAAAAAATAADDVENEEEAASTAAMSAGGTVPLELLEEALHWHRYANAIYGWPMYLWSHRYRALRCCRLCCGSCYTCMQKTAQRHNNTSSSTTPASKTGPVAEAKEEVGSCPRTASAAAAPASAAGATGTTAVAAERATMGTRSSHARPNVGSSVAQRDPCICVQVESASTDGSVMAQPAPPGFGTGLLQQQCQTPQSCLVHNKQPQHAAAYKCNSMCVNASTGSSWDLEEGSNSSSGAVNMPTTAAVEHRQAVLRQNRETDAAAGPPAALQSSNGSHLQQIRPVRSSAATVGNNLGQLGSPMSCSGSQSAAFSTGDGSTGATGAAADATAAASAAGIRAGRLAADDSCCCCGGDWGRSHVPKLEALTASQRMTREAIVQTARIPEAALLHVNYHNLVEGLLPYSVTLDESRRCVVVAIRGSLSVEDCVTDVLYDPAALDQEWLQPVRSPATEPRSGATAAAGVAAAGCKPSSSDGRIGAVNLVTSAAVGGAAAMVEPLKEQLSSSSSSTYQRVSPFSTAMAAAAAASLHEGGRDSHVVDNATQASEAAIDVPAGQPQQLRVSVPEAQSTAAAAAAAAATKQQQQLHQADSLYRLLQNPADRQSAGQHCQQQQEAQSSSGAVGLLHPLHSLHNLAPWRRRPSDPGSLHPSLLPAAVSLNAPMTRSPGVISGASAGSGHHRSQHSTSQKLLSSFSFNFDSRHSGNARAAANSSTSGLHVQPSLTGQNLTNHSLTSQQAVDRRLTSSSQVTSSSHASAVEAHKLSQLQRTTAADRALGAARAGHKYTPVTCTAINPAAAAEQRTQHHQQQQHDSSTGQAASTFVPANCGQHASQWHDTSAGMNAQMAGGVQRSRSQMSDGLASRPSALQSVSSTDANHWQQQQQGFALPASRMSMAHHSRLQQSWSEGGALKHSLVPQFHHHQQQQEQEQEQELLQKGSFAGVTAGVLRDGGPTDRSLLSQAAPMVPSKTAAVHVVKSPAEPATGVEAPASDEDQLIMQSPFMQQPPPAWLPPAPQHQQQQQQHVCLDMQSPADPCLQLSEQQQQQHHGLTSLIVADVAAAAAAEAEAEADAAAAAAQAAAAEETPDTGAAGDQWFAHEGILKCARAIRDDLKRLGLLDQLLLGVSRDNQNYSSQHDCIQMPPDDSSGGSSFLGSSANTAGSGNGQNQGHDGDSSSSNTSRLRYGSSETGGGAAAAPATATEAADQSARAFNVSSSGNTAGLRELPDCRGWTLMLVGHSLGAGVAALLALHYRCIYLKVRVWCFAPPGGLMSPAAAASLKDICYSLVSAKDMIPRMSLWTIERLRDEMMLCAIRCKLPKLKLLLGAAFGRLWEEHEVLLPLEDMTEAQAARYRAYRRAVEEERSLDPLRVRVAREFVPPGEIIWLERYKVVRPFLRVATAAAAPLTPNVIAAAGPNNSAAQQKNVSADGIASGSMGTPGGGEVPAAAEHDTAAAHMYRASSSGLAAALAAVPSVASRTVTRLQPHFTDGLNFIVGGMVVSRNMFMDHVPDTQLAQLKRLVRWMQRQEARRSVLGSGGGARVVGATGVGRAAASAVSADVPPLQQVMQGRVQFAV